MSVGKDVINRRNRTAGLGVLTSSKAGLGVIARCMLPSVGKFKGCDYNGSIMKTQRHMVEVKHNHGCIIHAPQAPAACNYIGVFNTKVRSNFIPMELAVQMLRESSPV